MDMEIDNRDWQLNKTMLESNKYMLENQLECDVTFTFLPPEGCTTSQTNPPSISAHKYMLISRSPVFYAMLAGPARDESGNIHIEDINKECFLDMLRYSSKGFGLKKALVIYEKVQPRIRIWTCFL